MRVFTTQPQTPLLKTMKEGLQRLVICGYNTLHGGTRGEERGDQLL